MHWNFLNIHRYTGTKGETKMQNHNNRGNQLLIFYKFIREFNDILMEKKGDSQDQVFNLKILLFDLENELKNSYGNWLSFNVFPLPKITLKKELFFKAEILNVKVNYCLN